MDLMRNWSNHPLILGPILGGAYGLYYILRKRGMYAEDISPQNALKAIFRGIRKNHSFD